MGTGKNTQLSKKNTKKATKVKMNIEPAILGVFDKKKKFPGEESTRLRSFKRKK